MRVHRSAATGVKLPKEAVISPGDKVGLDFHEFCAETSLHGFKYIGNGTISRSRRIFWALSVSISFTVCCWFSDWYIKSYVKDSVLTTIDTTTAPLSDVFFPSVTVCNVNQVQQSFLDFLNMTRDQFSLFEREFITGRDSPTSQEETDAINEIIKSDAFVNAYVDGFHDAFGVEKQIIRELLDTNVISIELGISRMAMQIQPGAMVPYAKFGSLEQVHQISAFTGTDYGFCAELIPYLFNYTTNFLTHLPPALKEAKPGVTNGENNGMTILLDAETYDYAYKSRSGEGFKVALHHHRDVAVMRQLGFNVAPGTAVNVAVKPILSETSETARSRFDPESRDCYFEDEILLGHWPYNFTQTSDVSKRGQEGRYGTTNCLLEAALQEIEVECECAPSFHPLGFDLAKHPTCQGFGITCVNGILDRLGNIDTLQDRGETKKCLAPCKDQMNPFQLSFLKFPNKHTFTLRTEVCYLVKNIRDRCGNPVKARLLESSYTDICSQLRTVESSLNKTVCDDTFHLRNSLLDNVDDPDTIEGLEENLFNYAQENVAIVNVFIKDPYVTRLRRDEAFPIINFVAGFGGLLGVFTGFSFISGIEVVYYIGDTLARIICWKKLGHTPRKS